MAGFLKGVAETFRAERADLQKQLAANAEQTNKQIRINAIQQYLAELKEQFTKPTATGNMQEMLVKALASNLFTHIPENILHLQVSEEITISRPHSAEATPDNTWDLAQVDDFAEAIAKSINAQWNKIFIVKT